MMMKKPKYLSPKDFAFETGLSLSHIYGLLKSGKLTAKRYGKLYLIPYEELENIGTIEVPEFNTPALTETERVERAWQRAQAM